MRTGEMEGVREEEYGLCLSLSIVDDEATKWYCDHPSCMGTAYNNNKEAVQNTSMKEDTSMKYLFI